jgi:hypothetical protein
VDPWEIAFIPCAHGEHLIFGSPIRTLGLASNATTLEENTRRERVLRLKNQARACCSLTRRWRASLAFEHVYDAANRAVIGKEAAHVNWNDLPPESSVCGVG